MSFDEAMDRRALIGRGTVQSIDDSTDRQRATITMQDGFVHSDVEVLQLGVAGMPAIDGAEAVLFAIGGDAAHLVALVFNPATRLGNTAAGDQVLCCPDGTRVACRAGGLVEIWGGTSVTIHAPTVTVLAPNGVNITGNVTITGNLVATGDISDAGGAHGTLAQFRADYDEHVHPSTGALTDHPTS